MGEFIWPQTRCSLSVCPSKMRLKWHCCFRTEVMIYSLVRSLDCVEWSPWGCIDHGGMIVSHAVLPDNSEVTSTQKGFPFCFTHRVHQTLWFFSQYFHSTLDAVKWSSLDSCIENLKEKKSLWQSVELWILHLYPMLAPLPFTNYSTDVKSSKTELIMFYENICLSAGCWN